MKNVILKAGLNESGKPVLTDKVGNQFECPVKDKANKQKLTWAVKKEAYVKVIMKEGGAMSYSVSNSSTEKDWTKDATSILTDQWLNKPAANVPAEQAEVMAFIQKSPELKPDTLKMQDLKWKYLVRSAMRGKNIMMTGPAGCGKTMAAKTVVNALDRPEFYFNLGATQDPRATLIGNVHFNKESGTFFSESMFVKAIQTENAVILMDELSRAHPEAWNILMTVLDEGQRYLRLDEADGSPTIKVAPGVTFIATANIGNEYTATRVMDRALLDRFIIVEMDTLNASEEFELLTKLFPNVDTKTVNAISEIAHATRVEVKSEVARISTSISTRACVEMTSLVYDGFSLTEAAEVIMYPQYDDAGGADSERTFVKQLVQKFCDDGTDEDLFNTEDVDGADDNQQ
tara:strand:+ start:5013 stop:6218 length:1206 start_codon:yes stop_codon:yes gene_type:complete